MKTRVLSSIVLVFLLILLFIFSDVPLFMSFVISLLSAAALYEVLVATKYVESKSLIVISLLFAVIVPFTHYTPEKLRTSFSAGVFLFAMVLFISLLIWHKKFSLEHLSVIFLLSLIIPMFFSTILYSRDLPNGLYNLILVFLLPWATDVGGYVFGRLFGRYKLAPVISPKKTVEGSVGGVASALVISFCIAYILDLFDPALSVNYVWLFVCALLCSILSIVGDLIASVIKRNFNIKDFGNIIPGHGGIMDRFDSVVFAAPAFYLLVVHYPIFF